MRARELLISAQRTGVEPDPRAGRMFRLAAVRLSNAPSDSDAARAAAAEAGAALVGLALAEAEDELRELLTPDPADHDVVWTVACYQIGDLTPSALRDFSDPVEAVATVAACPDESHVAAELVVSTAGGLRWTAVLRTNDNLAVQLPTPDTASDGSRERPGDLAAALRRWRERLGEWASSGGEPSGTERRARRVVVDLPSERIVTDFDGDRLDDRLDAFDRRLSGIEAAIDRLARTIERGVAVPDVAAVPAARVDVAGLEEALAVRLSRLEAMVTSMSTSVEATRTDAARPVLARAETEFLQGIIDLRFRAVAACVGEVQQRFEDVAARLEQRLARVGDDVGAVARGSADDTRTMVRDLEHRLARTLTDELRSADSAAQSRHQSTLQRLDGAERRIGEAVRDVAATTTRRLQAVSSQVTELTAATRDDHTGDRLDEVGERITRAVTRSLEPSLDQVVEVAGTLSDSLDDQRALATRDGAALMRAVQQLIEAAARAERSDRDLHLALFGQATAS